MKNLKYISLVRISAGVLLITLIVFMGCSSRQFVVSPRDENISQQTRTYSCDFDTVWNLLRTTVSDYRFQNDQKEKGLLQTYWRTRVIKDKGRLHGKEDFMHGSAIEDKSDDIPQNEMGDFELKERLSILVNKSTDSTTTVMMSYHFKITTFAAQGVAAEVERDTAPFSRKVFSPWDFYTKEDHRILEKVGELIKEKQAKRASK
jgi:hypothetical protein